MIDRSRDSLASSATHVAHPRPQVESISGKIHGGSGPRCSATPSSPRGSEATPSKVAIIVLIHIATRLRRMHRNAPLHFREPKRRGASACPGLRMRGSSRRQSPTPVAQSLPCPDQNGYLADRKPTAPSGGADKCYLVVGPSQRSGRRSLDRWCVAF